MENKQSNYQALKVSLSGLWDIVEDQSRYVAEFTGDCIYYDGKKRYELVDIPESSDFEKSEIKLHLFDFEKHENITMFIHKLSDNLISVKFSYDPNRTYQFQRRQGLRS